jgi:hypothetical protein
MPVAGLCVDRRDHAVTGDSLCDAEDAVVSLFDVLARDDGDDLCCLGTVGNELLVLEGLQCAGAITHEVVHEGLA